MEQEQGQGHTHALVLGIAAAEAAGAVAELVGDADLAQVGVAEAGAADGAGRALGREGVVEGVDEELCPAHAVLRPLDGQHQLVPQLPLANLYEYPACEQ